MRINIILTFCLLLILSCTKSPEDQLVKLLEKNYSNLYIDEEYKRRALKAIKSSLKEVELIHQNESKLQEMLNTIGDGHIEIINDQKGTLNTYKSGLWFFPGSMYVKSCINCEPSLPQDKYEIISIDGVPLTQFIESQRFSVAASSEEARKLRILKNLNTSKSPQQHTLTLKSVQGNMISTRLKWKRSIPKMSSCVHGVRINDQTFHLKIKSLWCNDPSSKFETRKEVLERFIKQFNNTASYIKQSDRIILDLRENGGGGDQEVEYVLNAFNENSVFMYEYQHLKTNTRNPFDDLISTKDIWNKKLIQYTNISNRGPKTFFYNPILTIISANCFSSCEGLASSLKNEKRSLLLGERTHGGAGDPVVFKVTNSPYSVNLPTCITWQKDGITIEKNGVSPDIWKTQDPLSNKDDVLIDALNPYHWPISEDLRL